MGTVLSGTQHFLFVTLTSWIAVAGGLSLWLGFVFFGLVSRRFEKAFGKITHWQFQVIAPVGATGYLLMQSVASLRHQNMGPIEQWIGYMLLTWSAGLCLWGAVRFWSLARVWTREE